MSTEVAEPQMDNTPKNGETFKTAPPIESSIEPPPPSIAGYFQEVTKKIDPNAIKAGSHHREKSEGKVSTLIQDQKVKVKPKPEKAETLIKNHEVPDYESKYMTKNYLETLAKKYAGEHMTTGASYIQQINTTYSQEIKEKRVVIAKNDETADELILKMKPPTFEEEIKRNNLKDYMKQKKALEDRLQEVSANITNLTHDNNGASPRREGKSPSPPPVPVEIDPTEFVKKMARERKEQEQKREKRLKEREAQILAQEEEDRRRREDEKKAKEEKRKAEVAKEREEIAKRNQQWREDVKKWEHEYEKKVSSMPKYHIENLNKYNQEETELLKKDAQRLKEYYRPIEMKEIYDHEKKFLEDHAARAAKRKEEMKHREEQPWFNHKKPDYESRFHKQFEEETKKLKEWERERIMKAKEAMDKRLKYADTVKEQYFPTIDEGLRVELKKKINATTDKINSDKDDKMILEKSPRELGMLYLQEAKKKASKKANSDVIKSVEGTSQTISASSLPKNNYGFGRVSAGADALIQEKKRLDPMKEVHSMYNLHKDVNDWQKIAYKSDLTEKDKRELIRIRAKKLEADARDMEKVSKLTKNREDDQEMDAMYLASIKAKLALLQDDPLDKQFGTPTKALPKIVKKKPKNTERVSAQESVNEEPPKDLVSGNLFLTVLKAENLMKWDKKDYNASVTVFWNGKEVGATKTIDNSTLPEWNDSFMITLANQDKAKMPKVKFEIFEKEGQRVSSVELDIKETIEKPSAWTIMRALPFTTKTGSTGRLSILAGFIEEGSEDKLTVHQFKHEGKVSVTVEKAEIVAQLPEGTELKARVICGGKLIGETNQLAGPNPEWKSDHEFEYYSVDTAIPDISVELFTIDPKSADKAEVFLGSTDFGVKEILTKPGEASVQDGFHLLDASNPKKSGDIGRIWSKVTYHQKK